MKSLASERHLLIFTDLDGTLLDHHSYSFAPAQPSLQRIKELGVPLIINSSKTRAEILEIQRQLDIQQAFICENGAGVFVPETVADSGEVSWRCQSFSMAHSRVIEVLKDLRRRHQFKFAGFSDYSLSHVSKITGLSIEEAGRAVQREFTEPLIWQDSPERLQEFQRCLAEHQLRALQGGRFLSVMGHFDKAEAMLWLVNTLSGLDQSTVIALGDSPNDELMLNKADVAVVIQSPRSEQMVVVGPNQVLRTPQPGPEGWNWAMQQLLPRINQ